MSVSAWFTYYISSLRLTCLQLIIAEKMVVGGNDPSCETCPAPRNVPKGTAVDTVSGPAHTNYQVGTRCSSPSTTLCVGHFRECPSPANGPPVAASVPGWHSACLFAAAAVAPELRARDRQMARQAQGGVA